VLQLPSVYGCVHVCLLFKLTEDVIHSFVLLVLCTLVLVVLARSDGGAAAIVCSESFVIKNNLQGERRGYDGIPARSLTHIYVHAQSLPLSLLLSLALSLALSLLLSLSLSLSL
jgi:hypothetical protein